MTDRPSRPPRRPRWFEHSATCTAVTGEPARLGGVPGATDGTVLTAWTGMPTVVYGPGGKWIAHQVDEFVEVAAIVEAAEVYRETALRFLASAGR